MSLMQHKEWVVTLGHDCFLHVNTDPELWSLPCDSSEDADNCVHAAVNVHIDVI